MPTETLTLTDFLLARITELETVANAAIEYGGNPVHTGGWILKWTATHVELHVAPARVLAECEAKRRIVEMTRFEDSPESAVDEWLATGLRPPPAVAALTNVLRALALPYADHPDYREEWKP